MHSTWLAPFIDINVWLNQGSIRKARTNGFRLRLDLFYEGGGKRTKSPPRIARGRVYEDLEGRQRNLQDSAYATSSSTILSSATARSRSTKRRFSSGFLMR